MYASACVRVNGCVCMHVCMHQIIKKYSQISVALLCLAVVQLCAEYVTEQP